MKTIVNPQCGEIVYTQNPGHICGTLPDHKHCTPDDCPEGKKHSMTPAHCLIEKGPKRIAAVQVQKIEIRNLQFTETTRSPQAGKVNHIEARGLIAIESVPVDKDPEVCQRTTHRHEYSADDGGKEVCVIPQFYPITLHLDLPIGDGCLPFLGDNLIVEVRRAYGRLEHEYKIE